ncbi:MAG: hypothetical protein B7Y89_16980 [Novosphingobium sp. 32-60-15]|uniref:transcriptional coactivator p15/PC4 family protein n=1 Tax=unclassified Novosphingobium TaxID=2644732 RepID=UPI000BD996EE|nr:MAG: hypothetical protein B7Y89_16980 [Novosphingobium sp. 32-60-15]
MTDGYIFEHRHKGNLWRLEVQHFRGRTFVNLRKWYADGEAWKPTRDGFTMPMASLKTLTESLLAYHGINLPEAFLPGS